MKQNNQAHLFFLQVILVVFSPGSSSLNLQFIFFISGNNLQDFNMCERSVPTISNEILLFQRTDFSISEDFQSLL